MSEDEWSALKNLILTKNPDLENKINKIEGIPENTNENFGIKNFLETIFQKYPNVREKKEAVKGHELSKLFSNKFPKYLEELSNKPSVTKNQHDYRVFSHYQGADGWFKTPWTILYDKEIEKLDKYNQYPYYIHYIFKEDIKKVYLGISLSWGHAKEVMNERNPDWTESERDDYFNIRKAELMEKLEKDFDIPNDSWS